MSRGARVFRAPLPFQGRTATGPTALGCAPSAGIQLAIDGREDPEPDEQVCEGQEWRGVERCDSSEERLHREINAHRDRGTQGTVVVAQELECDGMGTVLQVQM